MGQGELAGATSGTGIRAEYARRLEARSERLRRLTRWDLRMADARLAGFAAILVLAWLSLYMRRVSPAWIAAPSLLFVGLILAHDPIRAAIRRLSRAVEFYRRGLDRLDGRWAGKGVTGTRLLDEAHPYAADLDLFGTGSLFERLCTARTQAGEDTLAAWLLGPSPLATVLARQQAVAELGPRLDLREDLELLGDDVRVGIDPEALAAWGRSPRLLRGAWIPATGAALSALSLLAFAAWWLPGVGPSPFLLSLFPLGGFALRLRARVEGVLEAVESRSKELALLAELLARIERETLDSAAAAAVRRALQTDGRPASRQIAALARIVGWLEAKENLLFAPLGSLLLWTTQAAYLIDRWRERHGPSIAGWLAAAGEFEALCALAAYAAENPGDPFPELVEGAARFEADGLGHPLIHEPECVRNDIRLGEGTRLLIVSGSNMSGKSTLLRAVGVNAVLALAGGPVRAQRLRLAPVAVGATLRVQDSLLAGRSRFYAEITRLRQLLEVAGGPLPLLFLLDELFHGTSSGDRRLGAESLLEGLLARGAIGLVTTHDLALTDIAGRLAPAAENVHFVDRYEEGEMTFDYRMHPGVVAHSNALALMRAVGLDV